MLFLWTLVWSQLWVPVCWGSWWNAPPLDVRCHAVAQQSCRQKANLRVPGLETHQHPDEKKKKRGVRERTLLTLASKSCKTICIPKALAHDGSKSLAVVAVRIHSTSSGKAWKAIYFTFCCGAWCQNNHLLLVYEHLHILCLFSFWERLKRRKQYTYSYTHTTMEKIKKSFDLKICSFPLHNKTCYLLFSFIFRQHNPSVMMSFSKKKKKKTPQCNIFI